MSDERRGDERAAPSFAAIEAIVQAALELPPEARVAFVRRRCAGDAALFRAAIALIEIPDTVVETFLASSPIARELAETNDDPSARRKLPRRIGNYDIVRRIGEGGMGVVYEAEQQNPRRRVALKVIRSLFTSESLLRRFQVETNALGQLQHPGIARIYEAGTHCGDDGGSVPYFAMEMVRGPALDQFVRERSLSLRDKLQLFVLVVDAVEYAHSHGVIHRDLKPGNILIAAESSGDDPADERIAATRAPAQPKVIDFGVARVVDTDLSMTRQTEAGQVIGTLAYMSPEQISGRTRQVDARSDVYSLGVILYELVAGRSPFLLRDRSFADAARVISEEEATRLSSIDARLRGDIETIVSKAMEKSPERRYASAYELAADIRRYLRDEPIHARAASTFYQVRKFARRHRGLVAGMAAAAVFLVAGLVTTSVLAVRESRQRHRAESREAQATRLAYRAAISAAAAAIRTSDSAELRRNLDAAPAELRGWEWRYLEHLTDRSLMTLEHGGGAIAFALSADDRRIATRDQKGIVRVIEIAEGKETRAFRDAHAKEGPALDPAGQRVAWSRGDALVMADVETGEIEWTRSGAFGIHPDAFSADGAKFVAAARGSQFVTVYDAVTGRPTAAIDAGREVFTAQYRPDGEQIAARWFSGDVGLIDVASGSLRWCGKGWEARFLNHAHELAVWAGADPTTFRLGVYDTRECAQVRTVTIDLPLAEPRWDFSPDGRTLAIADRSGRLRYVDPRTGETLVDVPAHSAVLQVQHTHEGTRTITAGTDGAIRIWDSQLASSPLIHRASTRDAAYAAALSSDASRVARVGWGGITVIDAQTGMPIWRRYVSRHFFHAVTFSSDQSEVVVGGQFGELFRLNAKSGELVAVPPRIECELIFALAAIPGTQGYVATLDSGEVILLDQRGERQAMLGRHETAATCVSVSADGRICATGGGGGLPGGDFGEFSQGNASAAINVWNLGDRSLRFTQNCPATITCVSISADGRLLAAGSVDQSIVVVDTTSGETLMRAAPAGASIDAVTFSTGGDRVFVSAAGSLRVIRTVDGELVLTIAVRDADRLFFVDFARFDDALVAVGRSTPIARFESQAAGNQRMRRNVDSAYRLLGALEADFPLAADRLAAIDANELIEPGVREALRELVRALGDAATQCFSDAVLIAIEPGLASDRYVVGHRMAIGTLGSFQDDWRSLPVIGLLEARCGKPGAALQKLNQALAEFDRAGVAPPPTLWLGFGLARLSRGELDEAKQALARLRELASPTSGTPGNSRAVQFVRELEALGLTAP